MLVKIGKTYYKRVGPRKVPRIVAEKSTKVALTIMSFCLFSLILVITFFWYGHWTAFTADFKQFRNFCQRLVWDGRLHFFWYKYLRLVVTSAYMQLSIVVLRYILFKRFS